MAKEIILAKMAKDPPINATTMARTGNKDMSRMGEEFTLQVLVNADTVHLDLTFSITRLRGQVFSYVLALFLS